MSVAEALCHLSHLGGPVILRVSLNECHFSLQFAANRHVQTLIRIVVPQQFFLLVQGLAERRPDYLIAVSEGCFLNLQS